MANTKISQLPEWTGTAADLRWFVMNNSGETETYKFSGYTSPYKITGTNTLFSNGVGSSADTSIKYGVAIGNNSTLFSYDPTGNYVPGAESSVAIGDTAVSWGSSAVVIGDNVIGGAKSVIIGNNIPSWRNYGPEPNFIIGADITGVADYFKGGVYVLGNNFESTSDGHQICIGSGLGAGQATGRYGINIGWETRASGNNSIAIGNRTVISGGNSIMLMGEGNGSTLSSDYSTIVGGLNNFIDASDYSQILGGFGNTINNEVGPQESFNIIIGGSGNTINDASDAQILQGIINSVNTTLNNGVERVTAIGLSGRTIGDALTGATYVESLKAFRQVAEGFYDNGTIASGVGGYIIDWNNGAKQSITITGGTAYLYFIRNIPGGKCVLKVINTSTSGIVWADNAPMRWKLPASSPSSQPTHNATDIFVWESFDDQELWLTTHSENLS
jgi:hypothetical protein